MTSAIDISTAIFYIDDDQDDLDFFREGVKKVGESAMLFELAEELIATLENPPPRPSVIFLDINMPRKSGYELIAEIKSSKAFGHLPLIAYSTAKDANTISRCQKLGASLFVTKPMSLNHLSMIIRHVIEKDWENHNVNDSNFVFSYR